MSSVLPGLPAHIPTHRLLFDVANVFDYSRQAWGNLSAGDLLVCTESSGWRCALKANAVRGFRLVEHDDNVEPLEWHERESLYAAACLAEDGGAA